MPTTKIRVNRCAMSMNTYLETDDIWKIYEEKKPCMSKIDP